MTIDAGDGQYVAVPDAVVVCCGQVGEVFTWLDASGRRCSVADELQHEPTCPAYEPPMERWPDAAS